MTSSIEVPAHLRRPHPVVLATRSAAKDFAVPFGEVGHELDERVRVGPARGLFRLVVSQEELNRALRILEAIVREAIRRGYEIEPYGGTAYRRDGGIAIGVGSHAYSIELVEMTERLPLTEDGRVRWNRAFKRKHPWGSGDPPEHKRVGNGRLRLSLPSRWSGARCNWTDGPRASIERKLDSFFEEIERRASEDDERDEQRRKDAEERERVAARQREIEAQARRESARVSRLAKELGALRLATEAREYIARLRERLPELDEGDQEKVRTWCDWVERWASRSDPTLNTRAIRGLNDDDSDATLG